MSGTDTSSPLILPIVTVQPSFLAVISEVDSGVIPFDNFYISCYKTGSPSVHARVHASLDEIHRDVVNLEPKDGDVEIKRQDEGKYTVSCPSLDVPPTKIYLADKEYADPERANPQHPHRITAFDISTDGSQFATGFLDGSVNIYPTTASISSLKNTCKAHLSTVTSLQFFPSSRVLLSAGADFSLSILPAEPPKPSSSGSTLPTRITPVRTLRGHTREITSTAIISRGRNILSSSKDGTIRLWDVGSGNQIYSFSAGEGKYVPVLRMSLGERGEGEAGRARPDGEDLDNSKLKSTDPREVETQDKIVFAALQDGSFEAFDLGSKTSVYRSTPPPPSGRSALSSILYSSSHNLLCTGSSRGVISLYDTRSLSTPLTTFSRNTASIEDLAFLASDGNPTVRLAVATEDGLTYIANVRPEGPEVYAEIVSGDCDGVRAVKVGADGELWTAADDGVVRRFSTW